MHSVEQVKVMARLRTPEIFDALLEIFRSDKNIDVRRRKLHYAPDTPYEYALVYFPAINDGIPSCAGYVATGIPVYV